MPTRRDVTVTAGADSLAVALKPRGHLTARSVAASPKPGCGRCCMIGTGAQPRPGSRIFYTFRHWPQVPTGDLLQLRQALANSQEPADEDAASELLRIINAELRVRGRRREWRLSLVGARSRRRHVGRRSGKQDQKPDPGHPLDQRGCGPGNLSGVAASALNTHS